MRTEWQSHRLLCFCPQTQHDRRKGRKAVCWYSASQMQNRSKQPIAKVPAGHSAPRPGASEVAVVVGHCGHPVLLTCNHRI